ncbi:MAG TPA: nuclear transport factor 2 family protein [Candidatus Binataceae bacterium]
MPPFAPPCLLSCFLNSINGAAQIVARDMGGIKRFDSNSDELRAQTLKLLQSYHALIVERRFDEWIELWAEDGTCEFPYAPEGRPRVLQGKNAILAYMTGYPEWIAIDSIAEMRVHAMHDPELAVVEMAIKGRALTTGRPYNQRYVIVVEARNGKIWRYREYWNPLVTL